MDCSCRSLCSIVRVWLIAGVGETVGSGHTQFWAKRWKKKKVINKQAVRKHEWVLPVGITVLHLTLISLAKLMSVWGKSQPLFLPEWEFNLSNEDLYR